MKVLFKLCLSIIFGLFIVLSFPAEAQSHLPPPGTYPASGSHDGHPYDSITVDSSGQVRPHYTDGYAGHPSPDNPDPAMAAWWFYFLLRGGDSPRNVDG